MKVTFFPRNDYPNNVEVCAHRLGKKMTYTEDTDGFRDSTVFDWAMESLVLPNNIKWSIFLAQRNDSTRNAEIKSYIEQGIIWGDLYFLAPHSPEDTVDRQEYEEYRDIYLAWCESVFGIRPNSISYSYGNYGFKSYIGNDFLGGRNSSALGDTDYGVGYGTPNSVPYSLAYYLSKPSTTRWFNDAKDVRGHNTGTAEDFANRLSQLSNEIDACMLAGGWFNNFTHIHDAYDYEYDGQHVARDAYEDYFEMLAKKNSNNEIYFAGYGEAIAYLAYRSMIKRVAMFSPIANPQNELVIRIETDNSILGVDTSLLNVPISVKFSTANTPLEGQTIRSSRNLISLGNNQYIVEIPYAVYPMAKIEKVSM